MCACGLFIHPAYPHLRALPDGIITCSCCSGIAVLEVKCPYSCRDKTFMEACNASNFYLKMRADGGFVLNTTHSYYYQVQAQIKICKANFCDFVVWNENDLFIMPEDDFIESAFTKAITFFKLGILPELLGNWYSNVPVRTQTSHNSSNDGSNSATESDSGDDLETGF